MIIKIKYLIILLFLTSCGYSPIYEVNQKSNFSVNIIKYSGDKKIGREIEKGLEKFKNYETNNSFNINFTALKRQEIVTKDKKGDPSSFKITIEIDLDLESNKSGENFSKKLVKETTFDSMDNKFELNQYTNNIEKNMIFKILQDINIFLGIIGNDI